MLSYTLAACLLASGISASSVAAPISGVVGMASTDTDTAAQNSYSTFAGVSLVVSRILAESSNVEYEVEENASTAVQVQQTSEYANIAIAQVTDYVNVRAGASEETEVVGKLYSNGAATVLGTEGGWYHITSGRVDGYVKADYVVVGDEQLARSVSRRVATVATQTLYVRKEPTTESSVLGMVPMGDDLTVTDESTAAQGWVRVSAEEGDGYVSTDYVTLSTEYKLAESKAEEEARLAKEEAERKAAQEAAAKAAAKANSNKQGTGSQTVTAPVISGSGSELGQSVANFACQFVGNPYVWGGTSLTNGADCSGFVMSVYSNFGVSLPHSSSADRSVGSAVNGLENAQPGDIICYSGHVAIYIGGGQIVHASTAKTGIIISNANYRSILSIRRIF